MDSGDYTPFTDDATFTDLMLSGNSSVGVNLSMDDAPDTTNEQHVDPSSPVDPTPPRRTKGKPIWSKSFKTLEDIQICKAWLNISMDPIYGNEQKSEKYWDRITRKYHENSEFAQRTVKSIQGRWSLIRASIAKWNECYSKIQNLNQSGKTEYDKIVDAKQLFMTINESPFQFEHCWMVLRDQPKFQALLADNQKSKQSKVSKHSTPGASSQGNSSSINLGEDDIATEDATEVERPPGRKAEKARRGKNKETVVESPFRADLDSFHQLKHQQHLERMEQIAMDRAEREMERQRQEVEREERIMSMNLSNLEPQQVRYWRMKQEEVLKKYNPDG